MKRAEKSVRTFTPQTFGLACRPIEVRDAIIVDIDGTVANGTHRQHHLNGAKRDWKSFFEAQHADLVYEEVRFIVQAVFKTTEAHVFFCTARPSQYYQMTNEWLIKHRIPYSTLMMRESGDGRDDTDVKYDMLQLIRSAGFKVILAIDDRPQVINMWRRNDVPVLQVMPVTWQKDMCRDVKKIIETEPTVEHAVGKIMSVMGFGGF
jgi:hypothetical protein